MMDDETERSLSEIGSQTDQKLNHRTRKRFGDIPWCTVVTLFGINTVIGIFYYVFPFFYMEFVETFGVTYSKASWIGSLQLCTSAMTGLFYSGPMDKYGTRVVTFIGAVLMFLAMVASSFAPNVYVLCVTYGLVSGSYSLLVPVVLVDLVGLQNIGRSYAINSMCYGLSFLVGPPFAGWLFDLKGNYNTPFHANIVIGAAGTVFTFISYIILKKRKSNLTKNGSEQQELS